MNNFVVASVDSAAKRSSQSLFVRMRRHGVSYLLVLPYLILLLIFGVLPGIYALLISFADFREGTPQFFAAGLHNYSVALTDFRLVGSFINISKYLAISVPLVMGGSLLLVLLLHARPGKLSSSFRTIYFVPGAVAGPTAVLLAIFMFDPNVSPFRGLLHTTGYELLTDTIRLSNLAMIFAVLAFFLGAGGWIAILYGALNNISTEVLEAAVIDGCSMWQLAWHIKLPLIFPYLVYMLILVFAVGFKNWGLPYMPSGGVALVRSAPPGSLEDLLNVTPGSTLDHVIHIVLPAAMLALLYMAGWSRYMRSSMLEVLRQDYVRTARAKGLLERAVIYKHALRNALIPIITIVVFQIPGLFGGATLTETVFSYPGIGRLYFDALGANDWPIVMAILFITAILVVFATLLGDLLYTIVDPRIRFN